MKECGPMANNMVKACTTYLMVQVDWDFGKMVKDYNGYRRVTIICNWQNPTQTCKTPR
jgi:hypothetical protein